MTKAERLLFIINLFRIRARVTLEELALECGVSKRTIYRDLLSLSSLEIPIYYDDGYRLAADISLPALNFTEDEQELLGYSLRSSPLLRSSRLEDKIRNIELKILSAIPNKKKARLNRLVVNPKTITDKLSRAEDKIITDFLKALIKKEELRVSLKSGKKKYDGLYPVSLEIRGKKWRLLMTDKNKSRTVSVPLERISYLTVIHAKTEPYVSRRRI